MKEFSFLQNTYKLLSLLLHFFMILIQVSFRSMIRKWYTIMVKHEFFEYWFSSSIYFFFILRKHLDLIREVNKFCWDTCFNFNHENLFLSLRKFYLMVCFETMVILKPAEDFSVNFWLEKGVPLICPFKKNSIVDDQK